MTGRYSRKGGGHTDDLIQNLEEAGCDSETVMEVCRLYAGGQVQDAVRALRRHRCMLLKKLHESQERVDCLDFLVRSIEKQSIVKN